MSDGEEICSMEKSKARWVQMECELGTGVICFIWVIGEGLSNMGTSEQDMRDKLCIKKEVQFRD